MLQLSRFGIPKENPVFPGEQIARKLEERRETSAELVFVVLRLMTQIVSLFVSFIGPHQIHYLNFQNFIVHKIGT